MKNSGVAFLIDRLDNVATALEALKPGSAELRGDTAFTVLSVAEAIPTGHKIALRAIDKGEDVIKYGVRIGKAVKRIPAGSWVHLHNMRSVYDVRSSHLDAVTGAPTDIRYE